jgi:hypothetical protein
VANVVRAGVANVVRENEEDGGGREVLARLAARNRKYRMN